MMPNDRGGWTLGGRRLASVILLLVFVWSSGRLGSSIGRAEEVATTIGEAPIVELPPIVEVPVTEVQETQVEVPDVEEEPAEVSEEEVSPLPQEQESAETTEVAEPEYIVTETTDETIELEPEEVIVETSPMETSTETPVVTPTLFTVTLPPEVTDVAAQSLPEEMQEEQPPVSEPDMTFADMPAILMESSWSMEELIERRASRPMLADEDAKHRCRAEVFRVDVTNQQEERVQMLLEGVRIGEIEEMEVGALPLGVNVVFADGEAYQQQIVSSQSSVELIVTSQRGSQVGSFDIPIAYRADGHTTICHLNVVNEPSL